MSPGLKSHKVVFGQLVLKGDLGQGKVEEVQELLQEEGVVVVVVVVEEVPYQLEEEVEVAVVLLVVGEEEVVVADIQYLLAVIQYFEHPHLQPVDEEEKTRIIYVNASTRTYPSTNFIPDRSRPGLTTTAIGAVDLQGAGGNWATVGRRSRGGRRVHRQREKRKGKSVGLRIGTLNVGTMTGKGRELADVMERRKVDILCVQETRWKGSKARSIGAGFKLFYYGVDRKRNGVGVVLKEEFVRNVLEVKRVSDRVMSLKLEIEGVMLNVVSGYAPQVGCELEEKERFWSELDEVTESIPTGERVVIGVDFNGHVDEGNRSDEEVMGKFGVKERNLEGQMVVDFTKRMDMAVVNTYFQKREKHRVVIADLEKAYDSVPREELWYCMRKSSGAEKFVRVVQDMYERSRTMVRCAVGQTEEFKVEVGLHQGSALSAFLFAVVMDQLSEEGRQESLCTMFSDDIVICSESREQVEENLERWRFALERRGMKVSRSKTEYMCVNEREGSGTVRLQGEELKKVQEFNYLGSTVQSNGECGKEVKK
ncbi:hypothetical protein QTP70_016943 [Hemibagrus guttatus]|uniref:Reverse transcriptase domain-containing protein n=1 Tax=Hemibagrus guttatus TaxID=175788 RepID=A0AAE0QY67_9TELE|nr:hypothetical protein QTP70_016943 [Hemibagrus guttatus]